MKKKHMIPIILLSVALIGCGNKNVTTGVIEIQSESVNSNDEDVNVQQGFDSEEVSNRQASDKESTDTVPDGTEAENGKTDDTETNNSKTADVEVYDSETTDIEIPGKVAAFGDKSTMDNNVNGRELPIYCVDTQENKVALTFDAAWGAEDTQEILDILKKHDISVTFFATGGWVESYPDDVKAVLAAGHDLGNHSENHKNMSELSNEDKEEELMAVHRKVKELTGYDMYLFRPPYGDYDNDVINVAKDCEYYAIQWDVDSLDWQNKGVDSIIKTVTEHKNLGNGSIILCHNGAEFTAQALDTLINKLEEQGYEIVPISELIYKDNYHLNHEGRQISSN